MDYTISTWNNAKDNAVRVIGQGDWQWVVRWLEQYTETNNKNDNPLWNMNVFDAKDTGDYVEARYADREWYPRRCDANCRYLTGLVIDVDNDSILQPQITVQQAQQLYSKWTHAIVPSYSHLKDGVKHKFRVVIPFNKPLPYSDFKKRVKSIKQITHHKPAEPLPPHKQYYSEKTQKLITNDKATIDAVSYTPAQGFFVPSRPIGAEYFVLVNDGQFFDWENETQEQQPVVETQKRTQPIPTNGTGRIIHRSFDIVQWFKDNNLYIKRDREGKHTVICPMSHEHTGETTSGTCIYEGDANITTPGQGYPTLSCRHQHGSTINGFKWIAEHIGEEQFAQYCLREQQEEDDLIQTIKNLKQKKTYTPPPIEQLPQFFEQQPTYVEPYNRDRRGSMLKKRYDKWMNMPFDKHFGLYGFEGYGKSRIVNLLREDNKKVIFACSSNEQVEDQAKRFIDEQFRVQVIMGREHNLLKHRVQTVSDEPRHPWDSGQLNERKTKQFWNEQYGWTQQQADEVWDEAESEQVDFDNYDVIITTHARMLAWGRTQSIHWTNKRGWVIDEQKRIIPKDVVVVWDDVGRSNFERLSPYDEQFVNVKIDGRTIRQVQYGEKDKHGFGVGQRSYFVRPIGYSNGYGLDNRFIFTTTELLTTELIKRAYPSIYVPDLMPAEKMLAGNITLFKTKMTGRNRDGLLLPLFERVRKEQFPFVLIADGLGQAINHTTNKGMNCFADTDIVVEVSQEQPGEVIRLLDELEWSSENLFVVQVVIALDKLHQAVGRNSGYRWADREQRDRKSVVVLCDAQLFDAVQQQTRYYINHKEDLDEPNWKTYTTRPRNSLADCIAWYIQNYTAYLTGKSNKGHNKNQYVRDCVDAVKTSMLSHHQKRVERLLNGLHYLKKEYAKPHQKVVQDVIEQLSKTFGKSA